MHGSDGAFGSHTSADGHLQFVHMFYNRCRDAGQVLSMDSRRRPEAATLYVPKRMPGGQLGTAQVNAVAMTRTHLNADQC